MGWYGLGLIYMSKFGWDTMGWGLFRRKFAWCSVLSNAVHFYAVPFSACRRFSVLFKIGQCCSVLLCAVQCCSVVQCGSALFTLVPYCSVFIGVVMYGSVLFRTCRCFPFFFSTVHFFIAVPLGSAMCAAAHRCPVLFTDVPCCSVSVSAV